MQTGTPAAAPHDAGSGSRRWQHTLRITGALLAVWLGVTFGIGWFARDLTFGFFGWPFSFWVAAQGAPIVYVLLIVCYAVLMDRLDRRDGVVDDDVA